MILYENRWKEIKNEKEKINTLFMQPIIISILMIGLLKKNQVIKKLI